jgi:aquaporin Z
VILAVATSRKLDGNHIYGLAIGLALAAGAYAGGGISGGVYNPAVAFGPMIFGSLMGVYGFNNLIIYLIGPFAGAILAAWFFKYFNPKDS